jgi:hypothetical protein
MNKIKNIYSWALMLSLSLIVMASCSDDDGDVQPQPEVKSSAKAIASVSFLGLDPKVAGFVSEDSKVVSVVVPAGTDIKALIPTIVVSEKAKVSPASGAAQDFSSPVTYTVTAEDGSEQKYKLSVSKEGMIVTSLSAKQIERGGSLTIHGEGFSAHENTVWVVGEGNWGEALASIYSESATKIEIGLSNQVSSGKYYILVENTDGLSFMYAEPLIVGHPAVITSVDKTTAAAGEDIVFKGENFNNEEIFMIQVAFYNDGGYQRTYATYNEDGTRLKATVPYDLIAGVYEVEVIVNFGTIYTTSITVVEEK